MYTHDELDQMNKAPLVRAAHEMLEHVEQCDNKTQRIRKVSFLSGFGAALFAVLLFRIMGEVGIGQAIQFLFWTLVTAAAVYGVVKFWSEHQQKINESWSNRVRASIAQRLAVYGEKLDNQEPASIGSDQNRSNSFLERVRRNIRTSTSSHTEEVNS